MSGDITIDLGGALPYAEQRLMELFGKDDASNSWRQKIREFARISTEQASYVQSVGMHTPVPIQKIYQPARLVRRSATSEASTGANNIIERGDDAIVFAGPGRGKTTLLHHLYITLTHKKNTVPILFTLRWPDATKDLMDFVDHLSKKSNPKERVVFLVDGYDEISTEERQLVSRALLRFKSLKLGQFFLTCRTFYEVFDIKVFQYELDAFSTEDAVCFVDAFAEIYDVKLNAREMISELERRGFSDFISHPLMLTLVCILRTGPSPEIPRRAIGLIRRAIETLTFRWDEAKHVSRTSQLPLDGEERVRCLMSIAFAMETLQASEDEIERAVRRHLELIQLTKVNPSKLLEELARWYGILVPVENGRWQFVHRTIHDYLAARVWVESGLFASRPVKEWNIRAAYAACLLPDATDVMVRMLDDSKDIAAFSECLYNHAYFDVERMGLAVIARAFRSGKTLLADTSAGLAARTDEEFYSEAGPEFLRELVRLGSAATGHNVGNVIACYALSELHRRGIRADQTSLSGRLSELYIKHPLVSIDVFQHPAFPLREVITPR